MKHDNNIFVKMLTVLWLSVVSTTFAATPVITAPPEEQMVFLGDPVTFNVTASGSAPLSYQWYRNGSIESGATNSALVFVTEAADDADLFSVRVANSSGFVTSAAVPLTIDFGVVVSHTNNLIAITDEWRYEVSKTDLGTAWRETSYNDSLWPSGGGLLYVESSGLPAPKTTLLPLVSKDLPPTCYFRTWFPSNITNAHSVTLIANTVVDDGIVLYLNGVGVFTNRMGGGSISYSTYASSAVTDAVYEGPFSLDIANLINGDNLFAAEIHQYGTTSSDIVMGVTLDAVWQERIRDTIAPVIATVTPAAGTTVSNLTELRIVFNEDVKGVNATDLLINGDAASSVTTNSMSDYLFQFTEPAEGVVNISWAAGHGITDVSAAANAFVGAGFSYLFRPHLTDVQLTFANVWQSSDFSSYTTADKAVDGSSSSFSLTENLAGSYWMAEMGRPFEMGRIELVNRAAPDDVEMEGLTLSLVNMDDQVVYETVLDNPGSSSISVIDLPAGTTARSLRIGLSGDDTNGAGNYRVGMTEVRLFGVPNIPYAPEPFVEEDVEFTVAQSTDFSASYPAENAVDGNVSSFSHTDTSTPNNFWIADLQTERPIDKVELVNRSSSETRMDGYILRILDAASNSVASVITTNPGAGATFPFTPPADTYGRYVKVCLENGGVNGAGDTAIQLAEVRVFNGGVNWLGAQSSLPNPTDNLASSKRCYMLRIADTDPPASNVNDGDYETQARTTSNAFDGYWEVDLGATFALYGARAIAPDDLAERLSYTILRLFDENHDSVHSQPVDGTSKLYDIDLNGPVLARYVRIGLENKTRPNETDTVNKYEIGLIEVEVFGRPSSEVGIMSFNTSDTAVSSGESVTLDWSVVDVKRVEIFPSIGSVGAFTETNGVGDLSQNITESTEFIMIASNNAGIFTSAVGVEVDGSPLSVRISEVVADNKYSLEDGYGDAPDWIELRNTGNSSVDLTGWGLSDEASEPMRWVFPATNMPPHSTLIIFASNSDTSVDPAGYLHADFSLDNDGESLYLTESDGVTTVDSLINYPALDTDLAYALDLEGSWTFMEPTPGAVNTGEAYAGWLASLDWSHLRGFHETNFILTVTGSNPDSTILYSLDGSIPSIPYTSGISIDGTTAVRIQPVQTGYRSSPIQTKTFVFLDDVIASPTMSTSITQDAEYAPRMKPGLLSIPTISVVVPAAPTYEDQACSMEILWHDGQKPVQENCGVSLYGGAVQTFAKDSFQLAFRSEYGSGKLSAPLFNGFDHGVLARTSFDKLQLSAGNQDRTTGFYMSDRFVQDSLLDMGALNPHGRYVHLYLNGQYWGQYNCKELLDTSFLADYLGDEKEDYVDVKGNNNDRTGIGWAIGVGDPPDPEPWERVRALRDDFVAVSPYLDVSHFIDVMLLWGYGYCEQEFKASGPKDAGSGYKFWLNDSDRFLRDGSDDRLRTTYGPGYIWQGLHSENHPDFKMLLADRIYRNYFNNGAMTPAACDARLVARMSEIRDSFLAEAARWGYVSPATWETKGAAIRANMFPYRTDELIAHWRSFGYFPSIDPPTFNQYGGNVEEGFVPVLTSTDGTIYYTLDGTDPRLPGGFINPAALIWSAGAVTVTEDITITTRVHALDGTWSALAEPRFLLGSRQAPVTGDLLVTEISYNPAGSDDYEFLEIWNCGTNLVDLTGVIISNAVRYIFPEYTTLNPGEHIVVVEDADAFDDRYQNAASPWYWEGISVAGEWIGRLSDEGETISLVASNGTLISECSYRSDGDWPGRPDGGGSSLQILFPTLVPKRLNEQLAYLADGRNWSASSLYHGSPGRFESAGNGVVINEILAHSDVGVDWIELYNPSSSSVDISNLALTDDLNRPNRYVFPNGASIGTTGFLTLSANTLGFGFSELGAEAALLELSGIDIIRIIDRVDFPAVDREVPFGRYERSDGEVDFTELSEITPNDTNASPRVGPVVISEIMYAPNSGYVEYIEIVNISASSVAMYDASIPANTWEVDGVGEFAFPQGTVLQPDEVVIVSAADPATFRAQYGVFAETRVFGPWSGGLAAEGEKLKLLYPGDPESDGFVPMYRADHVTYRTNSVWPVANSGGVSLERRPLNGYGNDPISWRASPFTWSPGVAMGEAYPMGTTISVGSAVYPTISFSAIEGESYQISYTDSLTEPDWKPLLNLPSVTTNWVEVIDASATNSMRFYRILWDW